jgi:hypothetical protein
MAILRRQLKRPVYRDGRQDVPDCGEKAAPREMWRSIMVWPETVLRWDRELVAGKWTKPHRRPAGRPSTTGVSTTRSSTVGSWSCQLVTLL